MHLRRAAIPFRLPVLGLAALASLAPALLGQAVNNSFLNRIRLTGSTATSGPYTTVGATDETGEPAHIGGGPNATLWWEWTAPANGLATISTAGSGRDTVMNVYVGPALNQLIRVRANDNAPDAVTSLVEFPTAAGQAYQIVVFPRNTAASGPVTLNVSLSVNAGPPSAVGRDNFLDRPRMSGARAIGIAENTSATREVPEPAHPGSGGNDTIWWEWTAPANGVATLSTVGSKRITNIPIDTALAVYVGNSLATLQRVCANDDTTQSKEAALSFPTAAGQAYQIVVAGGTGTSPEYGNLLLTVEHEEFDQPPAIVGMDNFLSRPTLPGTRALGVGENSSATTQTGEPNHPLASNDNSIWWQWIAPANGTVTVDTAGSTNTNGVALDTVVVAYRGTTLSALSLVGSNDNTLTAVTSRLEFPVVEGESYQLTVLGRTSAFEGNLRLALEFVPTPSETGRLINVSLLTAAGGGGTLIMGFVTSGQGDLPLVARAVGPGLELFGIGSPLADPRLSLVRGSDALVLAANDDWGGTNELRDAFASVGAFPLSATSRDAALQRSLPAGSYSLLVTAPGTTAGPAIAEAYAMAGNDRAYLSNLSVRKVVSAVETLTVGFVISGGTRTVLVRAVGPGLTQFGVPGAHPDPRLRVLRGQEILAENDDWNGVAALRDAFVKVGAFSLQPASRDAAVILTLPEGAYTASVSGGAGDLLVEAYALP